MRSHDYQRQCESNKADERGIKPQAVVGEEQNYDQAHDQQHAA